MYIYFHIFNTYTKRQDLIRILKKMYVKDVINYNLKNIRLDSVWIIFSTDTMTFFNLLPAKPGYRTNDIFS